MSFLHPKPYRKTILFVSVLLGFVTAHALFETPNVVGGGSAKMIAGLFLAVVWKASLEFGLSKWQKKKTPKKENDVVV